MKLTKAEKDLTAAVASEREAVQSSMTPEDALILADTIIASPAMMFETQQKLFALSFKAHCCNQENDSMVFAEALNVLCLIARYGEKE